MGSLSRVRPVSDEQFGIMLDYMEKNRELLLGKVTPTFTAEMKRALWEEIAAKLNSTEHGCQKPVKTWIKTWYLWQTTIKRRMATLQKHLENNGKYPDRFKPLSAVQERCYMLGMSNDQSYYSDDDAFKEGEELSEKSLDETLDDSAMQIQGTPGTPKVLEDSQSARNNPNTSKNILAQMPNDSLHSKEKLTVNKKDEDTTEEPLTSEDDRRAIIPVKKVRSSSLTNFGFLPLPRKRLSSAKRMRLSNSKRMRLSLPENTKISGSRIMKPTLAGRMKRRSSDRRKDPGYDRVQEYISEQMKESSTTTLLQRKSGILTPRVELIKTNVSEKIGRSAAEEQHSFAETCSSENLVSVCKERRNNAPYKDFIEQRSKNSKPANAIYGESDISKTIEMKKVVDVMAECLHGSFSEDWKNDVVERLKGLTDKVKDVITEKVRDAISERVENDISMTLKDSLFKLPTAVAASSTNSHKITPVNEASAEVPNATDQNERDTDCVEGKKQVGSVTEDNSGSKALDKVTEKSVDIPTVKTEGLNLSQESLKNENKTRFLQQHEIDGSEEKSYMNKIHHSLGVLTKDKVTTDDEESPSDEEMYELPSENRKTYTQDVVGELRHLQSSRLERMRGINRALKTNTCATVLLSKSIDKNTDAINNLAKAIKNVGSLLLSSLD